MSSYLNADRKVLRAEARLILERMLAGPKTADEKKAVNAKLADVSLVLAAARNGEAVVVPMGWDEDQRSLWAILSDYHREEIEKSVRLVRLAEHMQATASCFSSHAEHIAETLAELKSAK